MEIAPKDMKYNGTKLFIKLDDGQTVRVIKTGQGEPLLLMHTVKRERNHHEYNEIMSAEEFGNVLITEHIVRK